MRAGRKAFGPAAHAMSPIGGVGINLAIQDAAAAGRILGPAFKAGALSCDRLAVVQTRRAWPLRMTQHAQIAGYFVMAKDAQGRFPDNPLCGDGWGWSFFAADDTANAVTTDHEAECVACYEPARASDLIYTHAYPVLER